jgi:hypothetical protein
MHTSTTLTVGKVLHPSECLFILYALASCWRKSAIGIHVCICSKYFIFPPYILDFS